ncbi:hypothetical protein LTR09_008821 [Extremus antarcticus]|uniref:Uncharacterized protein n=1 Tax=Extremus antarcticus TaxID=702011 RepID=A0AAJ0GA12_9PEZI|nr:hypothetical protein LTR09_008821 [Extremus antarcticus]
MDKATNKLRASLPARFLEVAYLVGKVPFRACKSDPRISYTLYIPQRQYSAAHQALQEGTLRPSDRLPLIVNIHGTRREATRCRDSLVDYANEHDCAILAPLFPAGVDGPLDLDSYKKLRSKTLKSDQVLLDIVDEVREVWPGVNTDKFTLIGCSGGGQFAHRFMYIHPERLQRVCVTAPGSTTNIVDKPWPYGTADVEDVFGGRTMDLDRIKQIGDFLLIVGEDDNESNPRHREQVELKKWLDGAMRKMPTHTGTDRAAVQSHVQTLKELHQSWAEHGIDALLRVVPGVGHSYEGLLPTIVAWLERDS